MAGATNWLDLYILSFNCARNVVDSDLFASHLLDSLPKANSDAPKLPNILVLALQEVSPIAHAFLGGSYLKAYYNAFRIAVSKAADGSQYHNILAENVGMTAIMVFIRDDVTERISWTETAKVGVGVQECGNKGAVGSRIGYKADDGGIVELTFVSAHLAPNEYDTERRNEDWKNVTRRLVFTGADVVDPTQQHGQGREELDEEGMPLLPNTSAGGRSRSVYSSSSYLFVAGDFNYRTASERPGIEDYQIFPRPTHETEDPYHYSHLLPRDQLTREMQANRTLYHLSEMPISFPPSYKYSSEARQLASEVINSNDFGWARNRWPSWCDRILYLDNPSEAEENKRIKPQNYDILPLFPSSDHRPVALAISVPCQTVHQTTDATLPPFEIDPSWKARRASARQKEVITGIAAYLAATREGNSLILASCLGAAAVYFALRIFI